MRSTSSSMRWSSASQRAALPGYLVVEMGPGADWAGLFRFGQVVGVVGMAGAPAPLSEAAIKRLKALRHSTAMLGWRPEKGETVEIVGGWFDGARVLCIEDAPEGSAAVKVRAFLMGDRDVEIPVARMAALR